MSIWNIFKKAAPVALPSVAEYLGKRFGLSPAIASLWSDATHSLVRGDDPELVAEKAMKAALRLASMKAILP